MSVRFEASPSAPLSGMVPVFDKFTRALDFISNIFSSSATNPKKPDLKEKNVHPFKSSKQLVLFFVIGASAVLFYSVYKKMNKNTETSDSENYGPAGIAGASQHCPLSKEWFYDEYRSYIYRPGSLEERQERFCHALQDLNTKFNKATHANLKKELLIIAVKIIYFKQKEIKWGIAVSDLTPEFVRNIFLVQKEMFYKKTTYNPLSLLAQLLFARPREVIPGENFPVILGDSSTL